MEINPETDVTSSFHGENAMWNSTLRATALITDSGNYLIFLRRAIFGGMRDRRNNTFTERNVCKILPDLLGTSCIT